MGRRPLIAGNWKMHMTPTETEAFCSAFASSVAGAQAGSNTEILLIPPFPSLDRARGALAGSDVKLGAQDVHPEPSGAFTGAVSGSMLSDVGCAYVLVGHSERRHVFGDDDAMVNRKLHAALGAGLLPILCVGEVLDDRKAGSTDDVISTQLDRGLADIGPEALEQITIAYEPVWAIGTGETATPEQAQETIAVIRSWVAEHFGDALASSVRILYGGSVKPANARELLAQPDIDGALVGGASLNAETFAQIVAAAD